LGHKLMGQEGGGTRWRRETEDPQKKTEKEKNGETPWAVDSALKNGNREEPV